MTFGTETELSAQNSEVFFGGNRKEILGWVNRIYTILVTLYQFLEILGWVNKIYTILTSNNTCLFLGDEYTA